MNKFLYIALCIVITTVMTAVYCLIDVLAGLTRGLRGFLSAAWALVTAPVKVAAIVAIAVYETSRAYDAARESGGSLSFSDALDKAMEKWKGDSIEAEYEVVS